MRYVALVDGTAGAYGATFPDAPGCTAMGETIDEAVGNAADALMEWLDDEAAAGRRPALPRSMEVLHGDSEVAEALASGSVLVLVPLVRNSGRLTRANISMDAGLLAAIDEAAENRGLTRSSFLASAAREKIEAER